MNTEALKESVTTWQTIRLICEAYLEAERAAAVLEAESIVKGEA